MNPVNFLFLFFFFNIKTEAGILYGILPECILVGEDVVEELAHFDDLVLRLLCCR